MLQQIIINGFAYDFEATRIKFTSSDGVYILPDYMKSYITEFSAKDNSQGELVYSGPHRAPVSQTLGQYKCEFSFTMMSEGIFLFLASLPPDKGLSEIYFDCTISFINQQSPLGAQQTIFIPRFTIRNRDFGAAQGGQSIPFKIETLVTGIMEINGRRMISIDQDLETLP